MIRDTMIKSSDTNEEGDVGLWWRGHERKVGFNENTAMRHRRSGCREVTVTSRLHRQRYRVIEKTR